MQRVLLVDLSQRYGGADIRVIDVATRLRHAFDLHVAVLQTGDVAERLKTAGVTLWPLARSRRDPRLAHDLSDVIRRLRPDVVDAHNTQSHLWGLSAARANGVARRIATVHSVYERSETPGVRTYLYGGYYYLLQSLASEGVAVCEAVARHMRERGFRRRPLHVIANGIEDPGIDAAKRPRQAGRLRIAVVGRLVPVKGHVFLLEALARLKDRVAGLECLVIGDGPDRLTLEADARRLGLDTMVQFLGHRNDVFALVNGVDVLCMPSLTEGLPYAALEAAMLDVPIVASAVGGLAEEFIHGDTARLVAAGDVAALADELAWCAEHPREAELLAAQAGRMVRERFSVAQMIERTAAVYAAAATDANAMMSDVSARPFSRAPLLGR